MMEKIEVGCQFCIQVRRKDPLNAEGVQLAIAAYIAHLIESHWDVLELGRERRMATGVPVNDAWTRI